MRRTITLILVALIGINFFYSLEGVLRYGIRSVDAWGIWLFKAKAFYLENGFPLNSLTRPEYIFQHPQYPIGLPWLMSLVYKVFGGVNETAVLLIYPFIFLLIFIIAYFVIRKMGAGRTLALLLVYLYSMFSPLLAEAGRKHPGEADIFIVLAGWISVWAIQKGKTKLVPLVVAVASQIKLEGVFLVSTIIAGKDKLGKKVFFIVLSLIPFLVWMWVRAKYAIPQDFSFQIPTISEAISRSVIIITGTVKEMLKVSDWYLFWILFWLAVIAQRPRRAWIKSQINLSVILMSILYAGVYLTTSLGTQAHLQSSIDRVLLQISPFVYVIWLDRLITPHFQKDHQLNQER